MQIKTLVLAIALAATACTGKSSDPEIPGNDEVDNGDRGDNGNDQEAGNDEAGDDDGDAEDGGAEDSEDAGSNPCADKPPSLDSVTPNSGSSDNLVKLVLYGKCISGLVNVQLVSENSSIVTPSFTSLIDPFHLEISVPAGISAGVYSIRVIRDGLTGELKNVYTAL
jgi:hypothetical protein